MTALRLGETLLFLWKLGLARSPKDIITIDATWDTVGPANVSSDAVPALGCRVDGTEKMESYLLYLSPLT